MYLICKIKLPVTWVNKMKHKEKLIIYVWLCSLAVILLVGIVLCLQRPPTEIVQANKDIVNMSEKIRAYYRNRPDYWGLNNSEAINLNLYVGKINNNQIINNLNKNVIIGSDINGSQVMPGQHSFLIGYKDLNKKECVELASLYWAEEDKLGLISVIIQNDSGNYEFSWGDKGLPLSKGQAQKYCKEKNNILWTFE